MCGVALGVLGVPLSDFLTWEIDDYVMALKEYRRAKDEEWEMVRWTGYYSLISFNGSDKVNPKDVWLPIDPIPTFNDKKKAKWRKLK
jgi:hypothetical protein